MEHAEEPEHKEALVRCSVPVALAAALVVVLAAPAEARNPGGRTFGIYSAGVSGDDGASRSVAAPTPFLGALVRVSNDDGVTVPLTAEELTTSGRAFLDSQTEPQVAVNSANASNAVGMFQEDRWSTGGARNLVLATSFDGGQTWTSAALQGVAHVTGGEFQRVTDPWVAFGPSNRVHATSLAFDDTGPDNAIFVHTSSDGGLTWGPAVPVIVDRSFVFFNDKQAIAADDFAGSPHRGNVYVAWDRLIEDPLGQPFVGTFTGPAMVARSTTAGASFDAPQVVFATGTNKQTIGNVPVVLPDGTVVVAGTYLENASLGKNAQKLWVTRSIDGGRTFAAPEFPLTMSSLAVPGLRTGDTVPSFAVDRRSGRLYASWQDVRFSKGKRNDVLVTSSDDAGQTWAAPVKANDTPPTAGDAFTPVIAVDTRGRVGILYYDLRDDTDSRDAAIVSAEWFTTSSNGGRTWSASRRVTQPFDHTAAAFAGGFFLGDYQGLATGGTTFVPFFGANLVAQANGLLGSDIFATRLR
jgi:hypothetical protein